MLIVPGHPGPKSTGHPSPIAGPDAADTLARHFFAVSLIQINQTRLKTVHASVKIWTRQL
jgi:hypothetical protein